MEKAINRKKIITGFIMFLAAMWLCTLISKSVYTTKLPMVSTISPESKYIEHRVEAEGIVIEGGKQAVNVLSGLRVESLMVHEGDRVTKGDLLFQVDVDDLKDIIGEKQAQIDLAQTEIDALLTNKELAQQKKELEETRAREDYDATSRLEDTDVERAYDKYVRAEQALEDFKNDPERWSMSEEAREEQEQILRDALQSAAYEEADAKRARDQAVKEAERSVEDSIFSENADASLLVSQMQLSELQEELVPYLEILNHGGMIISNIEGTVTDIYLEVGGRVPDSAAMLLTNDSLPCQFKVVLDKEQKKYVEFGNQVSVKLDGSSNTINTFIDYFSESQSVPGSFEILIVLPENMGVPGLSGRLICSKQGEKYECCISPYALHKEETRNYVYILKTREGILGEEYYVEEVNVKILDENDDWAAIESGAIDKDSRIIASADKEFSKGDVVRWVE